MTLTGCRWYFDAVSTSSRNESLTVVFFNHGPETLDVPYGTGPLTVQIGGTFNNGTLFQYLAKATAGATIDSGSKMIKGNWEGAGCSFAGISLDDEHPEYIVSIDNEELGIFGTMKLRSVSMDALHCFKF